MLRCFLCYSKIAFFACCLWYPLDVLVVRVCVCVCVCAHMLSHVRLFETPWTVAHQAPLSIEFSWQEYWSELPFPPPGDLPDPGIKPISLAAPTLAGRFFTTAPPGMPPSCACCSCSLNINIYWISTICQALGNFSEENIKISAIVELVL